MPDLSIGDAAPRVITAEPHTYECGTCGKAVPAPQTCADQACQGQLKKLKKRVRLAPLNELQKSGQDPFAGANVEGVVKVGVRIGMVISHSCDVDQGGDISFHPVRPFTAVGKAFQAKLRADGRVGNYLFLPAVGRMPEAAVELGTSFSLPAKWFGERRTYKSPKKDGADETALIPFQEVINQRLASLSVDGLVLLYQAQIQRVTRRVLELKIENGIEIEEPEAERGDATKLPQRGWNLPHPKWIVKAAPAQDLAPTAKQQVEPPFKKSDESAA